MDKSRDRDPFDEPDMLAMDMRWDDSLPAYRDRDVSRSRERSESSMGQADLVFLQALSRGVGTGRPSGRTRTRHLEPWLVLQVLRRLASPVLFLQMRRACRTFYLCSTHILRERHLASYQRLLSEHAPGYKPSSLLSHPVERLSLFESRVLDRYIAMQSVMEKRTGEMRGYGLYNTGFREEEIWQWMQPEARLRDLLVRYRHDRGDEKRDEVTFETLGLDGRDLVVRYSPRTTSVVLQAWDPTYPGSIRPVTLAEITGRALAELTIRASRSSASASDEDAQWQSPPSYSLNAGDVDDFDLLQVLATTLADKVFAAWSATRWRRRSKFVQDSDRRLEKVWYERIA